MPDIITSAFGPEITWHWHVLNKTILRSWTSTLHLMMHFLPQHAHVARFSSDQWVQSNVRDNKLWCLAIARHTLSSVSHWHMTAEACMCNTLASYLLVAGKSLGLSFLCGKAWYRCDFYVYIKEIKQQGPPPILWSDPAFAFPHIMVHGIDPTHGLFEMSNNIDMGDPSPLAC